MVGLGHKIGEAFEADLDRTHEWYRRIGMAMIDRLPVPTSACPKSWLSSVGLQHRRITRIMSKRQKFDFYGVLGQSAGTEERPALFVGRAVCMESKATGSHETSIRIVGEDVTGSGVQEHQLIGVLDLVERFGAAGTIVWRNGDKIGALPPDRLTEAAIDFRGGGRRSIPWDRFVPVPEVRDDRGFYVADWLSVVRQWLLEAHERREVSNGKTSDSVARSRGARVARGAARADGRPCGCKSSARAV